MLGSGVMFSKIYDLVVLRRASVPIFLKYLLSSLYDMPTFTSHVIPYGTI